MKEIIKVFILVGIILSFYLIFPIFLGILAIKNLNKAVCKNDLLLWGIITFIFISPIAGILMLTMRDEDFIQQQSLKSTQKHYKNFAMEALNDIENIYKLKENNVISEEEFIKKKSALLNKI